MSRMDETLSDSDMIEMPETDDAAFDAPSSDLLNNAPDSDLTMPPRSDLTTRIDDAGMVSGDDRVVHVTADDFVTSGDVAGDDVIDFGLSSDASIGGLGVNLDDLPGDEDPISRENIPG